MSNSTTMFSQMSKTHQLSAYAAIMDSLATTALRATEAKYQACIRALEEIEKSDAENGTKTNYKAKEWRSMMAGIPFREIEDKANITIGAAKVMFGGQGAITPDLPTLLAFVTEGDRMLDALCEETSWPDDEFELAPLHENDDEELEEGDEG